MTILQKIRRHFFTKEFLIFLVIGSVKTLNGTFLSWLYGFAVPDANVAFNLGYITANAVAYWMNSVFVFPEPLSWNRFLRFAISYIPNYIIQNIIVLIFYNWLGFPPVASYLIAAALGVPVTFLCVKLFAFERK